MKTWSKRITDWAIETFGKPTPDSALDRFRDELREFEQAECNQDAAEEAADMVITLANYVRSIGYDLAELVYEKEYVNSQRLWETNGDGTGKHIKEAYTDLDSIGAWHRFRRVRGLATIGRIERYARVTVGDDVKPE